MSTLESLTVDDLLAIRDSYYETSKGLKNTIVFRQRELSQDRIDALWEEANAIEENIRKIENQIFEVIVVDIEQPRQEIMAAIQKVQANIETLKEMNRGVDKLVEILKPFTTLMTMVFSPGSALGIVNIAELLSEIEAVA